MAHQNQHLTEPRTEYRTCACGNLIVLAHGEDECAVCYMKRIGQWTDPIEELRVRLAKAPNTH
jgi:hypothetical protein